MGDLHLMAKEKHDLTLLLEKEKNKRVDTEKKMDLDRKNFDKLKLDFEARIDTFRNRNTDIEDELRREIATLQKLIETLREQVTFERKRREVHDVNTASKTTTALVSSGYGRQKRETSEDEDDRVKRQVQNCSGSNCNQNNFGAGGFIPAPAPAFPVFPSSAFVPAPEFPVGGFGAGFGGFGATQNCANSNCNQNNG